MSRIASNLLLGAAIAAALASALPAQAQSAHERATARRAGTEGDGQTKRREPAKAATYPEATRAEPGLKSSAKTGKTLDRLFKAYEAEDLATAQPIGDTLIADAAANAYEKAIAARIVGSMLMGSDDARALAYMQQSVAFDGLGNNEHFETMLVVAQLQLQAEKYQDALATLDTFLAGTGSKQPDHLALKASALHELERYPEAIALLKPVVESSADPKPQWTQLLLAAYAASGQSAEAAATAERIAATAPTDKRAQVNLAATYLQSEQFDKAAAVYEKLRAAGQLTEDRDYRNLFSLYLNAEGKEREAIAAIDEGIAKGVLKPDYQTYVALAQAYYYTEQTGPSIEAYQKAAPLAPDGETWLNLAKVLANEGRAAESKAAAQQAIDKGVKNPDDARRLLAR